MAASWFLTLLDYQTLGVFLTILAISLIYLWINRRPRNLPPGPPGYPIIGNLLDVAGHPNLYLKLCEFAQQYAPIFLLNVVGLKLVVINDYEMIKEVFIRNQDIALYRPLADLPIAKKLLKGRGEYAGRALALPPPPPPPPPKCNPPLFPIFFPNSLSNI